MKIIIEIAGGVVNSVYSHGPIPAALDVVVVDLDMAKVGERLAAQSHHIESLAHAPEEVIDSVFTIKRSTLPNSTSRRTSNIFGDRDADLTLIDLRILRDMAAADGDTNLTDACTDAIAKIEAEKPPTAKYK